MSPDNVLLLISELKIFVRFLHCDLWVTCSVFICGKALFLDAVLIIIVQHSSSRQFLLVNIPFQYLRKFKSTPGYSYAVIQCIAAVMLRELAEPDDPGIIKQFLQLAVIKFLIIRHMPPHLSF